MQIFEWLPVPIGDGSDPLSDMRRACSAGCACPATAAAATRNADLYTSLANYLMLPKTCRSPAVLPQLPLGHDKWYRGVHYLSEPTIAARHAGAHYVLHH
jgi:hypothetical protein